MATEVVALRGKSPSTVRASSHTHALPIAVTAGQLIVIGVGGYSDLDPTDALTAGDLTQSAGTAVMSAWQLHRTDKRDAGSVEVDSAVYSARVLTGGTLTVQINRAVGRYWTLGSTGFSGNWNDSRQISVAGQAQAGPNVTAVTPGGVNAVAGDVLVGVFAHNSTGGSSAISLEGDYTESWSEPDAGQFCVAAMASRIAPGTLTADGPDWTLSGGLATNGGTAASMVVFRESGPPDTTPPTLSGPSGTATSPTSGSGSVTTDEAGGTLYFLATTSASATGAAVKAGSSQPVTASGAQAVSFAGLAASTTYYPHYLHQDAAGNDSAVSSGASFTTPAAGASITGLSTATPTQGNTLTINGSGFGATQGTKTVRMFGAGQTVTSWGDTQIQITANRGTSKYGVAGTVEIMDGAVALSNSFGVSSIGPQSGWAFVNIGTPNTTTANRITSTPDLVSGDQVAYNTVGGTVTVLTDGTFWVSGGTTSFLAEAWTNPDGWGAQGTQNLSAAKNAVAKSWTITPSSDTLLWSAWPAGDKP